MFLQHQRPNNNDLSYLVKCPEKTCLENYLGEAVRRINERVRIRSHTLQHTLQLGHPSVSLNEVEIKNFLKLYDPFLWMGFNCLKATFTLRRQFTFYHSVPRNSWYSFYWPRKDERLSRPWNHPVVLNTGPLDWESSTLTTRPLLHKKVLIIIE